MLHGYSMYRSSDLGSSSLFSSCFNLICASGNLKAQQFIGNFDATSICDSQQAQNEMDVIAVGHQF